MTKTKIRRKYKPSDITNDDLMLLGKASGLDSREKEFLCFGKQYAKLRALDLITDECSLSWYGKQLLKELSN